MALKIKGQSQWLKDTAERLRKYKSYNGLFRKSHEIVTCDKTLID